jgi:hypothetical protein
MSLRSKTVLILTCVLLAPSVSGQPEDEEFVGPFASWSNLQRDYGRDSAALQRALNEVGTPGHSSNLFIPAGTYCVQRLVIASRIGVSILGADPATTVFKYCGPDRGVLLYVNGLAYSRIGRLTLDCAGLAAVAVDQSWDSKKPYFDSGNEYSDVVFRNCPTAIRGGNLRYGFAETTVLRARFGPSSGTCVILKNFNALDLWIWYSLFNHCQTGVSNDPGAGNFNVYNSVFRNSAQADISIHNTGAFNIRNNTSIGSNAFWVTSPRLPFTIVNFPYPALTSIQGNKLIRVSHPAIRIRNQGPVLLMDNQIESPSRAAGPAVAADTLGDTDLLTAGNVFTTRETVSAKGRYINFDDKIAGALNLKEPVLPGTPPDLHRRVFEVPIGGVATGIQQAINAAARSGAPRAVVHIPEGDYRVDATLEIPRGSDLQITGDGYVTTHLNWNGPAAAPVIHVTGPSKVIFREIVVSGSRTAEGFVIEGIDQPGSRVHMQQAQIDSTTAAGLLVDALDHTNVDLRNIGHKATGPGAAIKVIGGKLAAAGNPRGGKTNLFSGASGNNALSYEVSNGGRLLVRDIWYEGGVSSVYVHLSGDGTFTVQGSRVALPALRTPAAADLADFHGSATFLTTSFDDRIVTRGDGANSRLLVLGFLGGPNLPNYLLNNSSPPARAALLNSRDTSSGGSSVAVPDRGGADPAFLREMLAQTRTEQPEIIGKLPDRVSDVRFYRVSVGNAVVGIHLKP